MTAEVPVILTIEEVATELRLSKTTVQRMCNGQLKNCPRLASVKIGHRTLIRRESLQRYLDAIESGVQSAA